MASKRSHSGSCQRGNIGLSAELVACNCSRRLPGGRRLACPPEGDFRMTIGEAGVSEPRFRAGRIVHRFCPVRGIRRHATGTAPNGTPFIAVNARCLDGVDLDTLPIRRCDGASY